MSASMRLPAAPPGPAALGIALVVALAAGLAQALSMATWWNGQPLWWLQMLSIGVLFWLLDRPAHQPVNARSAFFIGWLFATTWLSATYWWLFISMHTYGGLNAVLAVIAVVGLAAFLSLYYAAACAVFVWLARRSLRPLTRAFLFASLWLLAELLRGHWFTGFPWGAGGYAHVDALLGTTAKYVGVYGVGFIATLLSCIAVQWMIAPRERARGFALLMIVPVAVLAYAASATYTTDTGSTRVALLQGNIPQDEKFQPGSGLPLALEWYARRLTQTEASLIVAPETAIPLLPQYLPPGYWQSVGELFASGNRAALVGIPLGSIETTYANSAAGFKPGAPMYRYDKHHLVPFGEFVPPMFRWFTDLMQIPLGDFGRGGLAQAPFEWNGQRFAPNICYEDLFGEEIGANFADASRAPTVLVNLSNIGWFGNTVAVDQHLAISRMRAIEFERPMIRATNTGATVIIDHRGHVTDSLQRYTRGVLVGDVHGREGITPFAWWVSRVGLWPLWLLGLLPAVALAFARRKTHI